MATTRGDREGEAPVRAWRVGRLCIGAHGPEEAATAYSIFTGEPADQTPEPELADEAARYGSTRLTLGDLLREAIGDDLEPPLWLASMEEKE